MPGFTHKNKNKNKCSFSLHTHKIYGILTLVDEKRRGEYKMDIGNILFILFTVGCFCVIIAVIIIIYFF